MCTGTSTNPVRAGMRHLSLTLGLSPSTCSAAQRWPLSVHIPALLQDNAAAVSSLLTKGNCTPLQGVLLSLASLLPATFTPSAPGPSCPPCQIIPWSQITFSAHTNSHTQAQPHAWSDMHPQSNSYVSLRKRSVHTCCQRSPCSYQHAQPPPHAKCTHR